MTARRHQQPGKFHLVPDDITAEQARRYTLEVLTLCGLCDGFRHYGDPQEGQQAFREHANQTHANQVDRGQQARRRAAGQILRSPRNPSK